MTVYHTDRLRFRRITSADLDLLATLHADPDVMRYITGGSPEPRAEIAASTLPRWLAAHDAPPPVGYWAAFAGDDFAGWFMLRLDADVPDALEVGYRLHRAYWGRGLATEGGRLLVECAFTSTDTQAVTGQALAANTASRHVLEKIGLRFERAFVYPTTVLPGRPAAEREGVRYTLSRADWQASAKQQGRGEA